MYADEPDRPKPQIHKYTEVADKIAEAKNADVLVFNGPVVRHLDRRVIRLFRTRRRRPKVVLMLVTSGGDPDAAYRIARSLQEQYEHVTILIPGYCKSAGTMIALGAQEFVISDNGELGPLDVQMSRKDEIFETQSGLTASSALSMLNEKAFEAFERFFIQLKLKGGSGLTTRTATEIASNLTAGLFAPIYQQVDPMHVGEAGRAMDIAKKYGEILHVKSQNFELAALDGLASEYPSHTFVIDRNEAEKMFKQVRGPDADETELIGILGRVAVWPAAPGEEPFVAFLSSELPADDSDGTDTHDKHIQKVAPEQPIGSREDDTGSP